MTSVTLFDNGDFSQLAYLVPTPSGPYQLKFTTKLQSSRHPHEERTALTMILDAKGLEALKHLVQAGVVK